MIYLDTSVALAHLFAEDRHPPDELWTTTVVSSRLLEYELWVRMNARGIGKSHGEIARGLLARVALVELSPRVLARAIEPFPAPLRTLDALHLASADFLRGQRQEVVLATYDEGMQVAGARMGFPIPSYCRPNQPSGK